jgi:hypothetical protein
MELDAAKNTSALSIDRMDRATRSQTNQQQPNDSLLQSPQVSFKQDIYQPPQKPSLHQVLTPPGGQKAPQNLARNVKIVFAPQLLTAETAPTPTGKGAFTRDRRVIFTRNA